jgi:SHS family lactate transporter-like MFS transporter
LLFGRTFGDYTVGWRAMFLLSVLPAFVVLFIRSGVPESPAFEASKASEAPPLGDDL